MNIYTPAELVRLELLTYENPEGLHPIEKEWRNLCRKLAQDATEMSQALKLHHYKMPDGDSKLCFDCQLAKYPFIRLPEKFKPLT